MVVALLWVAERGGCGDATLESGIRSQAGAPGRAADRGVLLYRALIRDIREQSDELQLRVYLEAAAMAICGLFVVMLSYSTMQEAGWVGPLDYPLVVMLLIGFWAIGYIVARRRYR